MCKKRRSRSFDLPKAAAAKSSSLISSSSSSSDGDSSSNEEDIRALALMRRKIDCGSKDIKIEENQSPLEIKVAAAAGNKRCLKCEEKTVYDPKYIETTE